MNVQNRMVRLLEAAAGLELNLANLTYPEEKMKVSGLKAAAKALRDYVSEHSFGASHMEPGFGDVTKGGKRVAHISYNGRIWDPESESRELTADDIKRIEHG